MAVPLGYEQRIAPDHEVPAPSSWSGTLTIGHNNRIYTETMEQTVTCSQIAAAMSEVFGREIRYEAVPSADWPAYMTLESVAASRRAG